MRLGSLRLVSRCLLLLLFQCNLIVGFLFCLLLVYCAMYGSGFKASQVLAVVNANREKERKKEKKGPGVELVLGWRRWY